MGLLQPRTRLRRLVRRIRALRSQWTLVRTRSASYDRDTAKVMARVLERDSNGIDVGAHIGDIVTQMVTIAPEGAHHAFEALPHLAEELRRRFPRVQVHQAAVSDHRGSSEFHYVENAPAYSGLRRRLYDRADPKITVIQVAMTTLDDAIDDDTPIALIKMDIEGGEYHAIKGATRIIRRWRPVIVFEAGQKSTGQYGITPDDVYALLVRDLGYELSTMRRWLTGRRGYAQEEFRREWELDREFVFIASPGPGRPRA